MQILVTLYSMHVFYYPNKTVSSDALFVKSPNSLAHPLPSALTFSHGSTHRARTCLRELTHLRTAALCCTASLVTSLVKWLAFVVPSLNFTLWLRNSNRCVAGSVFIRHESHPLCFMVDGVSVFIGSEILYTCNNKMLWWSTSLFLYNAMLFFSK